MKKVFYVLALIFAGSFLATSCNNDDPGPNGNYGDLSVRPALQMTSFYSKSDPSMVYDLTVDGSQPTDTIYEVPQMKASYCVYNPVEVPAEADTFIMRVNSNARWSASCPSKTGLMILTSVGNGDSDVMFRCTANSSKTKERVRYMYFYSNDSTTMHKVTIVQAKKVD